MRLAFLKSLAFMCVALLSAGNAAAQPVPAAAPPTDASEAPAPPVDLPPPAPAQPAPPDENGGDLNAGTETLPPESADVDKSDPYQFKANSPQ